jgi:RNA polymerase-binding transcription factor DksA
MSAERTLERETELHDSLKDARIESIRAAVPTGKGPEHCIECGNDMPEARRDHGYVLCVECKTLEEK